ncbi:hypothetical protein J2X76_006137 [Neorhizobium sp. 2083]|uniref:chromosomal replication initiator DnaA n=1 Tax=Neorhizobium sp. 2083 TaxID=2817762 RepID=UPI00286664B0|nr:chromosomal replication initiator DnaA [Neorhizobium sp. 2083]MDR6820937.1 hypothetical protein [Neorhizobium sp. 2083]
MAHIKDPILFSEYFKISEKVLDEAGLIDPFIDVDTPLFIDPVLLEKSGHEIIAKKAIATFRKHFSDFIRLIAGSEREGDVAWRNAKKRLNLNEPPENGLGYGGAGRSGSSRPEEVQTSIMQTCSEIVRLGSKDPEMISLMGFFEENVGPDTISDFTTRVIIDELAELTAEFCRKNKIPIKETAVSPNHHLPVYKNGTREVPIVLVPKDIVRELPVANDWSDIEAAALANARIRERVNDMLGSIAQPTVADRKAALRGAALQSADDFAMFLATVKEHVAFYDPNTDSLGYYRLKSIFANGFDGLKQSKAYDLSSGADRIVELVRDTINFFKHHVENGNLWEELWVSGKPKKERAAQLIYYALADCFCAANNVDISPEANMGGGPIDFKFSTGYTARVLVEMKRSSGTVKHGYEKQLEIYKTASRTEFGIFVVMDFGDMGNKLDDILEIQRDRIARGERASEIIVIDATRKLSASKRK